MKDLLKYLEENKNPNLIKEVNYGFEYCISLMNLYQDLQLMQTDVVGQREQLCDHSGDENLHEGHGFIYKTCADCGEDI
jgi:hypothetical protein